MAHNSPLIRHSSAAAGQVKRVHRRDSSSSSERVVIARSRRSCGAVTGAIGMPSITPSQPWARVVGSRPAKLGVAANRAINEGDRRFSHTLKPNSSSLIGRLTTTDVGLSTRSSPPSRPRTQTCFAPRRSSSPRAARVVEGLVNGLALAGSRSRHARPPSHRWRLPLDAGGAAALVRTDQDEEGYDTCYPVGYEECEACEYNEEV